MKRTPREKKRLSYERDRRNTYGESPHSSRKSIPRRKAFRNRANRHRQELALRRPPAFIDEDQADRIEAHMFHYAPKVWKKVPDKPLGVTVALSPGGAQALRRRGPPAAPWLGRHRPSCRSSPLTASTSFWRSRQ